MSRHIFEHIFYILYSDILCDIKNDILSGILPDINSDILSGIHFGILSDVHPDILFGIFYLAFYLTYRLSLLCRYTRDTGGKIRLAVIYRPAPGPNSSVPFPDPGSQPNKTKRDLQSYLLRKKQSKIE